MDRRAVHAEDWKGKVMGIHAVMYYEEPNGQELVDIDYQCGVDCMDETLIKHWVHTAAICGTRDTAQGSISWGAWPCGSETDYDVYCSGCGDLLWKGMNSE